MGHEEVRPVDPFEARFTFADGEALVFTVGDDLSVVAATGSLQ